jgi:DME family drug/metabolite transporter
MSGLLKLLCAGLLFGAGGPVGGLLARTAGLSPLAVAAYRLILGGILIVIYLMCTGRALPRGRAAWLRLAVIGALAALCQGCYFAAASLSSVTLAVLVTIGLAPVLVLVAERLLGWRGRDRRLLGALVLALAGLGLLVGAPGSVGLAGVLLAVLAAAAFAAITLVGARPVSDVDELGLLGLGFCLGGTVLALVAPGLGFRPGVASIGLVVLLGAVPTGLAYGLYFRGLGQVGAGRAAVLALLEPLSGAVLAAVLLGDRLGAVGIIGAGVLGGAMIMATSGDTPVTQARCRKPGPAEK